MVALIATTSALEMLLDLQPVSSLNSQDKLPRGKQQRLRSSPETPGTARYLEQPALSPGGQQARGESTHQIDANAYQPNLT